MATGTDQATAASRLPAWEKSGASNSGPPLWLGYVALAYPALIFEVYTQQQQYFEPTRLSLATDTLRVGLSTLGWMVAVLMARHLPDRWLPAWYALKRKGADALKQYGDEMKPVILPESVCVQLVPRAQSLHHRLLPGNNGDLVRPLDRGTWRWQLAPLA